MKHLLMDPAFPDLVGGWAADDRDCANDNKDDCAEPIHDLSDPLLTVLARMEIAATRLW
jgi:hypothetical protein